VLKSKTERRGDATCMMCGWVVGEIQNGRFIHHPGCDRSVRWLSRLPRCCRCGGSLYYDPSSQTVKLNGIDELVKAANGSR
jgi:hypothetical protein